MNRKAERHFLSADGLSLHYMSYGADSARAPILCLPGLTRNARDFEDLAPRLGADRRALAPDMRGRGRSEWDPDWRNYKPRIYVADVWRLLDELGIDRVVVIGTSLGGLMAMIMAAEHPERLAGAILNDIGPEVAPEGLARISEYTGRLPPVEGWEAAVAQSREIYGDALPGLSDAQWARLARRSYRENEDGTISPDMDPNIGRALREQGGTPGDTWALFDALRDIPTLVLRGELSDILSAETLARMQARKPDLQVATIPRRGHVPLLDEPESLAAIDAFLARL